MNHRTVRVLLALGVAAAAGAGCGGAVVVGEHDVDAGAGGIASGDGAVSDATGAGDASASTDGGCVGSTADDRDGCADAGVDAGCPNTVQNVVVPPGGTLQPRPTGSTLRLRLSYLGSAVYVTNALGMDLALAPSAGPFAAGVNAGYWAELQDGAGTTLYTELLRDPTVLEGVSDDGGFANGTVPRCTEKLISVDVPNDPSGHALVIFGSPYGTQDAATEIGRFLLP